MNQIPLPTGSHEVRFEYRSPMLRVAAWTTIVSLLGAIGLIGASFAQRRRSQYAGTDTE